MIKLLIIKETERLLNKAKRIIKIIKTELDRKQELNTENYLKKNKYKK